MPYFYERKGESSFSTNLEDFWPAEKPSLLKVISVERIQLNTYGSYISPLLSQVLITPFFYCQLEYLLKQLPNSQKIWVQK
jgi:hypothetical protein